MATVLAGVCLLVCRREACAQAFLPPAGEGNLTISYQNMFARGHLDLNGDRMPGESGRDPMQGHAVTWDVEWGLSRKLAVNASIPYIAAKYSGSTPHLVGGVGPPQEWDNGEYHGTFQDVRVGARFNLTARPIAITPLAEVIIPSHHYPSLAHAAVGKDLRAVVIGVAAGGFLDALLPRLFFQAQVTHAWVEEVLGIRPNRSRLDAELGYFITPRLSVRFIEGYQVTHQGVDLIAFAAPMTVGVIHDHPEIPFTVEYRRNHDRLQRTNYLTLGGGVGFALSDSLEVFTAAANTVWGENIHPLRAITVGVNLHLRTR